MQKKSLKNISLHQLRKAFRISAYAKRNDISDVNEVKEQYDAHLSSRRKFIGDVSKTAAFIGMAGLYEACNPKNKSTQPVIAIVGAGIAGLHAAYVLKNAGYASTLYEATQRSGGRIFTVPEMMGKGLWTEMGGEFIDTDHEDMINLAKHFNLPLLDRQAGNERSLKEYAYYFNGKHYELKDILTELHPYAGRIKKDIESLSPEINFETHSEADARFDNMSIMNYVDSLGIKGWFREFINVAYVSEYGSEATDQSAISFLSIFDPGDANGYKLFGTSDERFSVIGGNSKICEALSGQLKDQIQYYQVLTAIDQNNSKQYVLTFKNSGGKVSEVKADILLLALPFTLLREVDIKINLPEWKMNAIKNLGYGMNSKLFIGVNERVWRKQDYAGYAFSDNGMMNGYDHTEMQNNNEGIGGYTINLGGKPGIECGSIGMDILQKQYVPSLDAIFPGIAKTFNGKFLRWYWPDFAFSKCSYTAFKVGQYTTICGATVKPVDDLYFAGEHCSYEFQGFMNGGAKTGREAAETILARIKK